VHEDGDKQFLFDIMWKSGKENKLGKKKDLKVLSEMQERKVYLDQEYSRTKLTQA